MAVVYGLAAVAAIAASIYAAIRLQSIWRHRRLRGQLDAWLIRAGFEPAWGDRECQTYTRPLGGTGPGAPEPIQLAIHSDFLVLRAGRPLAAGARPSSARLQAPSAPTPISGDPRLDPVLGVELDDGGEALPLMLAGAPRRAGVARFLACAPGGRLDRHAITVSHGRLAAECWLDGDDIRPPALAAALDALLALVGAIFDGFDAPIPADLGRVAADDMLLDDIRRRARRALVLDHPDSAEARAVAPGLVHSADAWLSLCAGRLLGDVDALDRQLRRMSATEPPTERPVPERWARMAADAFDRFAEAGHAFDPAVMHHDGMRHAWFEAGVARGDIAPLLRAVIDGEQASERRALLRLLRRAPELTGAMQGALITALGDASEVAREAAEQLAERGDAGCLHPLATWRAAQPTSRLTDRIDAGLARMRSGLDPALVGQLALAEVDGGGLALTPRPHAGLATARCDVTGGDMRADDEVDS